MNFRDALRNSGIDEAKRPSLETLMSSNRCATNAKGSIHCLGGVGPGASWVSMRAVLTIASGVATAAVATGTHGVAFAFLHIVIPLLATSNQVLVLTGFKGGFSGTAKLLTSKINEALERLEQRTWTKFFIVAQRNLIFLGDKLNQLNNAVEQGKSCKNIAQALLQHNDAAHQHMIELLAKSADIMESGDVRDLDPDPDKEEYLRAFYVDQRRQASETMHRLWLMIAMKRVTLLQALIEKKGCGSDDVADAAEGSLKQLLVNTHGAKDPDSQMSRLVEFERKLETWKTSNGYTLQGMRLYRKALEKHRVVSVAYPPACHLALEIQAKCEGEYEVQDGILHDGMPVWMKMCRTYPKLGANTEFYSHRQRGDSDAWTWCNAPHAQRCDSGLQELFNLSSGGWKWPGGDFYKSWDAMEKCNKIAT
jgi:hypothetical protein